MGLFDFIALIAATFVLAVTPGPVVVTLVSMTITRGIASAVALVAGVIVADALLIVLALNGLAFLAQSLGGWFVAIKVISGAYLIFLGLRLWWTSRQGEVRVLKAPHRPWRTALFGLTLNLSNPKALVFYAAFLPAFVDIPSMTVGDGIAVTLTICAVIVVVNAVWIAAATGMGGLLRRPGVRRWTDRATGTLMIGTGGAIISR